MKILVHFSIDDVIGCLLWLTKNNCKSIFESYVFDFARELHEKYGIHTTCNCMYANGSRTLADVSDRWKHEFQQNNEWLKFSFHCYSPESDYSNALYDETEKDYLSVKRELCRIAGRDSISDIIRLHLFSGSREAIKSLYHNGVKILLTADDRRGSYDLQKQEYIKAKLNVYRASDMELFYIGTDGRAENIIHPELFVREVRKQHSNRLVLFTHESFLNDDIIKNRIKQIFDLYKQEFAMFVNLTGNSLFNYKVW